VVLADLADAGGDDGAQTIGCLTQALNALDTDWYGAAHPRQQPTTPWDRW
jgi:hypothetical protein